MYTENCTRCFGLGVITGLKYKTMKKEKVICQKCKGAKVIHYKLSPELRERRKKQQADRRKKLRILPRKVPAKKILEEYDYE